MSWSTCSSGMKLELMVHADLHKRPTSEKFERIVAIDMGMMNMAT